MIRTSNHKIIYGLLPTSLVIATLVVVIIFLARNTPVHALPEYAARTGASCATCHVSPGGGGPLTLGGMSWVADNRPDQVGTFDAVLMAPGVQDAAVLYDVACAACHGVLAEGLSASALHGFGFSKSLVRRSIVSGVPFFNMPSFNGQFTDEQLEALVAYVSGLSSGNIVPQSSYPLPPGELSCSSNTSRSICRGN